MNLTAATVTVYFIGLVHFHDPDPTATLKTREVILPLAPSGTSTCYSLALQPHQAKMVIQGLTGPTRDTDCRNLPNGAWNGTTCTVNNVSGKRITLPASSGGLSTDVSFDALPNLKGLCDDISGIKSEYLNNSTKYAARLTLDSGKLDACSKGDAWVSRLTLTTTANAVLSMTWGTAPTTTTKSVTLDNNAVVKIYNNGASSPDERSHFFWYYQMYDSTVGCTNMPKKADLPPCGVSLLAHIHGPEAVDTASGVGCSNTIYP